MTTKLERTPAPIARGVTATVTEAGRRPWVGTVMAVKWSPVSGWWIEVRDDAGGVWVIAATDVEVTT